MFKILVTINGKLIEIARVPESQVSMIMSTITGPEIESVTASQVYPEFNPYPSWVK